MFYIGLFILAIATAFIHLAVEYYIPKSRKVKLVIYDEADEARRKRFFRAIGKKDPRRIGFRCR